MGPWGGGVFGLGKHLGPVRGTNVDFDKICVFCGKCCVRINTCLFIVVKIKCVNSSRISDICDKVNFTTKVYTFYNTRQIFCQNTHKYYKF